MLQSLFVGPCLPGIVQTLVIQEHMCLTLGVDIPITSSDTIICSTYYKLHLQNLILNQMTKEEHSYNSALQSLIDILEERRIIIKAVIKVAR